MGTLSAPCSRHHRVDIGQTVTQVSHFYDSVNLQSGSSTPSWLFILFYPVHYFNCSESVNYLPPMATVNCICYYKHWLLMATGQSLQWADQLQVLFPEQAKCYAEHEQRQKCIFPAITRPLGVSSLTVLLIQWNHSDLTITLLRNDNKFYQCLAVLFYFSLLQFYECFDNSHQSANRQTNPNSELICWTHRGVTFMVEPRTNLMVE